MAHRIYTLLVMSLLSLSAAFAQQPLLPVPYSHGFEDTEENKNWFVESVSDNRWTVGTAEKSDGTHSMYVSFDGGKTSGTSDNPGYISVYRDITLEERTDFEISFDWKNIGIGGGELYVCYFPTADTATVKPLSSNAYELPSCIKQCQVTRFSSGDSLFNQSAPFTSSSLWRNVTFEVRGLGVPMRLLFLFRSRATSVHKESGRAFSAACIDNIQITENYACARPSNIRYEQTDASRGVISWEGDLGPFTLQYCKVDTVINWTTVTGIGDAYFNPTTQRYECPVRALRKGAYIVKIKQICEATDGTPADTSMWTTKDILNYYPENSCLNFTDLYDENTVSCYVGTYDNPYGYGPVDPIDFGYASGASRHTVHYDPNEFDKWSNYNLRTTPGDGQPSVRLGNYTTAADLDSPTSMAEAITYRYYVDPDTPILIIKFALLLEDARHGADYDPKFDLVISNYNTGEVIGDVLCGKVKFVADFDDPSLKTGANTTHEYSPIMLYKDWTTTGINLQAFAGRMIGISFESRECARGGHASYAYFTMDCMAAKISGVGCGDDMFGAAPDGFRYKWYPRKIVDGLSGENSVRVLQAYFDNPDFSDTLKTFTPPVLAPDDIAEGDGIYVCRIISKEDEDCWFELQADLDPRDVYADASLDSVVYNNGEARAYFTNKSYTKTRYRDETGRCDYFQWDAGTGKIITEENPTIVLPPGKHNIRLSAYLEGAMEGNACVDTWDTTITIPANPDESATITPATTTCTFSPNPIKAGQSATITLPDHIDLDNSTIEIINSAGQPITTHTLSSYALSTSTSHISIPHSAFPTPGLYMLRITTPDRTTYTGKLLVE